jgi:hypothetical protein
MEIKKDAVLQFRNLSLAKAKLFNVNIDMARFDNVQWHYYKKMLQRRYILYDELLLRDPFNYNPAEARRHSMPHSLNEYLAMNETLYRKLKMNYLREGDYKNAGDFHYGEMEMHRRANKWRWFPFYWYNLYRVLSGYGERPSWALAWLAVFLVGMAGLVWSLGLQVVNPSHIANFSDSFIYLLQKATLQRPTWAEPVNFWGKLVAGFSVLLIPGQAALFLLALRNRLGSRRR